LQSESGSSDVLMRFIFFLKIRFMKKGEK